MAAILWTAVFGWHVLAAPDPQTPQPSAPAASSDSRATIDKYPSLRSGQYQQRMHGHRPSTDGMVKKQKQRQKS